MKSTNCKSFTFYGILLLLLTMISFGQSTPYERYERFEQHKQHPLIVQNAAIFGVPKVAKEICPEGMTWSDGKCRILID